MEPEEASRDPEAPRDIESLKIGVKKSLDGHMDKAKRLQVGLMVFMILFAVEFVVLAFLPIFVLDTDTQATVIALVVTDCLIALACTMSWVVMSGSAANISRFDSLEDMEYVESADAEGDIHSWLLSVFTQARSTTRFMHNMSSTFLSVAVVVLLIELPNGVAEDTDAGLYDAIMLTITRKRLAMIILAFLGLMIIEPFINFLVSHCTKRVISDMHPMKPMEITGATPAGVQVAPEHAKRPWLTVSFVFNTGIAWMIAAFAVLAACIVGTQATTEINISDSVSWVVRLSLLLVCSMVLWLMAQCVSWANTHIPTWAEEAANSHKDPTPGEHTSVMNMLWQHVPSFRNHAFTKVYIEWSLNLCLATAVMIIPYLHHGSLDPTMESPKSQELLTSMIIATTPMVLVLLHGVVSLATAVVPSVKTSTLPSSVAFLVSPPIGPNAVALRAATAALFVATLTCAVFLFISLLGVKSFAANAGIVSSVMIGVLVLAASVAVMFLRKVKNEDQQGSLSTLHTQVNIVKTIITLLIVVPIACAAAMNAEVKHPQDLATPQKYWANIIAHVVLLYGVSQVFPPLFRGFIPGA